jgi:hypothetical protein
MTGAFTLKEGPLPDPEPRFGAGPTLRRLVAFVAAALDAQYAFIAAFDADAADTGGVTLWMARDFGLGTEFAQMAVPEGAWPQVRRGDYAHALRRYWWSGTEPLAELTAAHCIAVPLLDARGRLLGHLGLLDPGTACGFSQLDRLQPLARLAATEVQRWNRERSSAV